MTAILIVDDEQDVRELIQEILENARYQTLTASNGTEALKIYAEEHPDLMITDLLMPEKDGIETIIELKRIDPNAKIIAISGDGIFNPIFLLHIAKKLGAEAAILKPINRDELLSTVRNSLLDSYLVWSDQRQF